MINKFTKDDIGVYVVGVDENNPTEQSLKILEFAIEQGYGLEKQEVEIAWEQYREDNDLPYYWYEDLADELEFAIAYLNIYKCEKGVGFTFVDTNFALIDANGLDNSPVDKVE